MAKKVWKRQCTVTLSVDVLDAVEEHAWLAGMSRSLFIDEVLKAFFRDERRWELIGNESVQS